MTFDKIKTETTWNDASASINSNFAKIQQALEGLVGKAETYTHVQNSASAEWIVEHGLGRHPSVSVVDSGGTIVYGEVTYNDENRLTIAFTAAFSGKAYLN